MNRDLMPANYEQELAKEIAEIQKRIAAPTGDRIRTNGSKNFILPDGSEGTTLTCVIVDFVSTNLYYDSPFQKDTPGAPACFAIGLEPSTLAPSDRSPVKQAETCAPCVQNQFGSALTGKGKACRNTRQLAIMAATTEPSAVNDTPGPVWLLSVPPTSLKAFDSYVTKLRLNKTVPSAVVTEISMDPAITYTNLEFTAVRALAPEELPMFYGKKSEAKDRLLTEPDVSQYQPPKRAGKPATAARR